MSQTIAVFTISLSKNKKNYIVDNKGVYFRKSFKKTKKKTLDSKMCCLICFPCFRFKFCHAEQRKENDPHCSKRSFRLCIQQHVTKKSKEKNTKHSSNDNNWRLDLWLYVPTKHLLSVLQCSWPIGRNGLLYVWNHFSPCDIIYNLYLKANKLFTNIA